MSVCITTSGFQMIYVPPPGPPLNLTATASSTQVNLSWSAAAAQPGTSISKYIIYRNDSGNWPPIGTSTTTSFSDTAVQPLTSYSYYVVAIDSRGAVSSQSNQLTITSLGPIPSVPTGLAVSGVTSSSITLSWSVSNGASTYKVLRNSSLIQSGLGSTSFTDTGLNSSTTYSYNVIASNSSGDSAPSSSVNGTTNAVSGGSLVWKPGIRGRVGGYTSASTLTIGSGTLWTTLQGIFNQDTVGAIKGICISPTLAQLEGAMGDYTPGFNLIQPYLTYLKGLPIPRDLTVLINGGGNGWSSKSGGMTSPNFLSSFCPTYMNNATYSGGEIHFVNGAPLDRPYLRIDNANVCARIAACVKGLYDHFGPDTPTGGIYRYDMYQEISIAAAAGISYSAIAANFPAWMQAGRAGAPRALIIMKPTYAAPDGSTQMRDMLNAMFANNISMACEDMANGRDDYGMKMFRGVYPSLMYNHTTANAGKSDWDFHGNVDDAELESRTSQTTALPPAVYGSGMWYDKSASGFPGMWTVVNTYKATHVDVYMSGSGGPPVNRSPPNTLSGTAPNPTPGPGAGLTSSRPNMIDVFMGNTSFAGIEANTGPGTGVSMAQTSYPFGYP